MMNNNAMGIIFPNSFDKLLGNLVSLRTMASMPFASRYRLGDFVLSSMSNSGISDVVVLPKNNYLSLMEHLGTGREWDLARKNGGVQLIPPFAENGNKVAAGRIDSLANVLRLLKTKKAKYVVLADANLAVNFDFNAMIEAHIASGADVTAAYNVAELPESFVNSEDIYKDFYYSFDMAEDGRVTEIQVNPTEGTLNLAMNYFVMDRELLIEKVQYAFNHGQTHFTRDLLWGNKETLKIYGYKYEGYVGRVCSINSYFYENMALLEDAKLDALFAGNSIYTKVYDDNPTRYIAGAKVKNAMIADGCVIEGEVENCVIFRGVKVAKGAKVTNSILMDGTVIEADATVDYMIVDKNVTISAGKTMKGDANYPVYLVKDYTV